MAGRFVLARRALRIPAKIATAAPAMLARKLAVKAHHSDATTWFIAG
jgi:hypothetical protein